MQIQYIKGDLLEGVPVIIHGCNAQGKMNSGVAEAIRKTYPWAYEAYFRAYILGILEQEKKMTGLTQHQGPALKLGSVVWAMDTPVPRIVGNAITQEFYGYDGAQYVSYDAVRACMQEVERFVRLTQDGTIDVAGIGVITEVGMPMIGSKLGGGDWNIIAAIIEEESGETFRPIVYLLG